MIWITMTNVVWSSPLKSIPLWSSTTFATINQSIRTACKYSSLQQTLLLWIQPCQTFKKTPADRYLVFKLAVCVVSCSVVKHVWFGRGSRHILCAWGHLKRIKKKQKKTRCQSWKAPSSAGCVRITAEQQPAYQVKSAHLSPIIILI